MSGKIWLLIASTGIVGLFALGVASTPAAYAACSGDACASVSINVSAKEIINKDKTKDIHIVGCLKMKERIAKVITCNLKGKIDVLLKKGTDYSWAPLEAVLKGTGTVEGDAQVDLTSALFAK